MLLSSVFSIIEMLLAAMHNLWRSLPYVLLFTFQPLLICILILISLHQFPGGGELSLSDQNGFSAVRWVKPVGFGFCRNVITWNNNSFCLCVLVYVNNHPNHQPFIHSCSACDLECFPFLRVWPRIELQEQLLPNNSRCRQTLYVSNIMFCVVGPIHADVFQSP